MGKLDKKLFSEKVMVVAQVVSCSK